MAKIFDMIRKKKKDDTQDRTFIVTDGCMWERNKQEGSFHPHAIEVVDSETGQVRYIQSGAKIKFVEGQMTEGRSQKEYNAYTK